MNDVINDIAFLAGCNKHRYSHPNHPDLDGWIINQEALDKFAELIVKEAMAQIQEVRQLKSGQPNPIYEQGVDDGMFVAIRTIEEHFGVDEE